MAIIFKFKIKKINIYPFGGYTIFEDNINASFICSFMLFLGGILFQTIFFIIAKNTINNSSYLYRLIENYNASILLFNMIPIVPLDGAKIINILFDKIFPFKMSHLFTIYTSYIVILIIIMFEYKNFNLLLMVIMLLVILIKEHKNHRYIFNAFLIERYINAIKFKNVNFINNLNFKNMKKYSNNVFIKNNKYISEKEALYNKFN